jgi:hypothetical protein
MELELQEVELLRNLGASEDILTVSGGSKQLAYWCFLAKRYNRDSPVTCRGYLELRAKTASGENDTFSALSQTAYRALHKDVVSCHQTCTSRPVGPDQKAGVLDCAMTCVKRDFK